MRPQLLVVMKKISGPMTKLDDGLGLIMGLDHELNGLYPAKKVSRFSGRVGL